ncbi:MAG: leucine-rich repeat protein [Mogibacterium sp.]|nr:leucine-rich repeat protein [Mogibacterium sp.]
MKYRRLLALMLSLLMIIPMPAYALEGIAAEPGDQTVTEAPVTVQVEEPQEEQAPDEGTGEESAAEESAVDEQEAESAELIEEAVIEEQVEEEPLKKEALSEGSGTWGPEDFTYDDQDLEQHFSTYPATHSSDKLTGTIHVITGFSESGEAKLESNKELVIPAQDTEGKTVQGIGASAFKEKGITALTLPSGIMTDNNGKWDSSVQQRGDFFIGNSAFSYNELTELVIPEGVIYIGMYAFRNNKLTEVTFSSTVLNIAQGSFAYNELTTLNFPKTTVFPIELDRMSFAYNKLTEVHLPEKTMKVTKQAFMQNTGKEPVVSTASYETENNAGVVYMYIKNPGKYIEDTTNGKCNVQKLIADGSGETPGDDPGEEPGDDPDDPGETSTEWTAADFTFAEYEHSGEKGQWLYGCDYTRQFTVSGLAVTGFSEQGEKKLETNKDLVIPATDPNGTSIVGVTPYAFSDKGLTSVKFPTGMLVNYDDTVTYRITKRGNFIIGENAFSKNKLTSVNLPDGVIAVMSYAFANNELETVTLPKTVWWVETMAFANNKISKVRFPETTYFQFEMHGMPFANNKIKSVRLPDYTRVVNKHSFMRNPGMERLTEEQLQKAFNATAYANLTEEDKANIGIVYMYTDAIDMEDYDRIHHIDQQTESTKSYFQKLIINDGTPGTQYQDEDAWNIKDFTVEGTTITGLSASGIEKRSYNKNLVIPDYNAQSDRITAIASAPAQAGGLFATADEKFETVTLPSSLLSIGDNAFREAGLVDVAFPPDLEVIGESAFQMNSLTNIVLPDTVTDLGKGAFASNKTITKIILSSGLTEIPDGAFGCSDMDNWMTGLTEIEIPEGITRIGSRAFAGNNFSSIYIPDGVTEIGEYAFSTKNYLLNEQDGYCDVRLPESLTSIGNRAFRNKNVAVIHLPESVTALGAETFEKVLSTYGTPDIPGSVQYDLITRVYVEDAAKLSDSTNFPESKYHTLVLTDYSVWTADDFEIADGAVTGFSELGRDRIGKNGIMSIPAEDAEGNKVTAIGASAFAGEGVASVTIPEGITTIGEGAFRNNALEALTLPSTVTDIQANAFAENAIDTLTFPETTTSPLAIGSRAFAGNMLLAVELPEGTETVAGDAFIANTGLDKVTTGTDEEKSGGVVNLYVKNPGSAIACIADGTSNVQALIADADIPDASAPWASEDFAYDETGAVITGFSYSGKIKYVNNKDVVLPDTSNTGVTVTEIGDSAFAVDEAYVDVGKYDYNTEFGMTSVVLPQHLEKIGNSAFIFNSLEAVDLEGATELKSIGETAFKGNHLRSVRLTDNVTSLGSGAFSANSITDIRMPHNNEFTVIPSALFSMNIRMSKVEIPDTITEIGEMAFAGARLTRLTIPASVTRIDRKAFHLHHLTSLTIPGNVKEIGESAFEGTFKEQTLKSLTLSEGIESIGKYAFKEGLLTAVELPYSLKTIGAEPFLNNTGEGIDHVVALSTHNRQHLAFNEGAKTHKVSMISVKVTFDANGGSCDTTSASTNEEGRVGSLPVPLKAAYTFTGWYTDKEDGIRVTSQTVFEEDTTVYARYELTPWGEADFTFDGDTVTGFTEAGLAKLQATPIVTMPAMNGDTMVTKIGEGFKRNTDIEGVVMPDSITSITNGAFTGCSSLSSVVFSTALTEIPAAAFSTCNLTSVNLPEGIVSVGDNAFLGNMSLTSLKLPSTLKTIGKAAFRNAQLTELDIPGSVTSIGDYAFRVTEENLQNTLTSLTLNEGLETIGNTAFGRSALTEVVLPSTVKSIHKKTFAGSTNTVKVYTDNAALMVSDNPAEQLDMILAARTVTFDGNGGTASAQTATTGDKGRLAELPTADKGGVYAFDGWYSEPEDELGYQITEDTVIPESMTVYAHYVIAPWSAADFTFDETGAVITGLSETGTARLELNKDVVLPSMNGEVPITAIGDNAFEGKALESVVYPDKLTTIGVRAFRMTNLKEAVIPSTVTSLGEGAYAMIFTLEKIELPDGITSIPDGAFVRQLVRGDDKYDDYPSVGKVVIPEGVTYIGNTSFQGLNITELVLPDTLTEMAQAAFSNNKIREVEIPGSLKAIPRLAFGRGMAMFRNPVQLEKLTLNEGTESIGTNAFENSALTEVVLPSTINSIDDTAFRKGMSSTEPKDGWVLLIASAEQRANPSVNTGSGYGHRFQYVIKFEAEGQPAIEDGKTDADGKIIGGLPEITDPTASFSGWFATGSETAATNDDVYKADTTLTAKITYAKQEIADASTEAAEAEAMSSEILEETEKIAESEDATEEAINTAASNAEAAVTQSTAAEENAQKALEDAQKAAEELGESASEEEKAQAAADLEVAERAVATARTAKVSATSAYATAKMTAAKASANKAAAAKAAAASAAVTPDQNAVNAAQTSQTAAAEAAAKADEAKTAAEAALAAAENAGLKAGDEAYDKAAAAVSETTQAKAAADLALGEANSVLAYVTNAKIAADTAAANARIAAAQAAVPQDIQDLKAVKISKPKAAKKKVTVKWKKVNKKDQKKIGGIEIQVATDPDFVNIVKSTTAKKSKTNKTIKGLQSKTTYWVRIRAYKNAADGKHVSAWKTKKVKIK